MWVDFDGTVWNIINVILADPFIIREDLADNRLTLCSLVRAEMQLVCRGIVKESAEPAWEIVIEDIPRADSVQYRDGVLYVQTAADTVQTVPIELP